MPRNSKIDRNKLGATVLDMSSQGKSATLISSSLPGISKQQVDRYVQKNKPFTSAISLQNKQRELLVAAIQGLPDRRDTHTEGKEFYGMFEISTQNIFDKYYSIARGGLSGQISRAFINISLKITNGIKVVGPEGAQDTIDEVMTQINFKSLAQDIARSQCEMGTVVVPLKDIDGKLTIPRITPINYITLLTERENIGEIPSNLLIHGEIDRIVHGESTPGQIIYERGDAALFRIWDGANYFNDIKGRSTFGIYGASMVPDIENPLKSMMNASYYYDEFIKRYGMGRLHIDMRMVSEMYKDNTINREKSASALEAEAAALQNIKANEDIVSIGEDVKMLDVQNAFDITTFFEFREKQIDRGLLQSDVAGGNVGNEWTSSGNPVNDQELKTLQSMRDTFFSTLLNEIVIPHLEFNNISTTDVSIYAEPLSHISVAHRDLIEMRELGEIASTELRHMTGFPDEMPGV